MSVPIRVLHVDDEPDVADLTATFLVREADDITVETATSGAEALDRLENDDFDCVVSDYEMPGLDGLELLDAIRAEDPDLPFILFTGEGSEAIASDAIATGVTDYLQKKSGPEQYELLATRIRNAVEHDRAEQARQRHLEAIETAREGISILDSDGEYSYVNEAYADLYGYERAALEHGIDQVGVGVASYDDQGRIQYANEAYARLVGTTREALTGTHIWDVNPGFDPDRFEDYWNSYDIGETRTHETVHERFDTGQQVQVRTTTTRIRIDDTTYHIGTITDITEQKTRETQLQREVERLDKFAGIVSHDLRNPLNVAQGHLGLIAEECDTGHDHIDTVRNALDRMNELITDTLTLARQGRTVNETEPTDLGALARESWRNTDTGGAVLDVLDELTIHTDPERFRSVLENLFRNSAEHAGNDAVVTVGALPDRAGFYVEDDGPGIPDADRADIFEAGYSTATESSGFGLTIVKEIAEAHGWEISVTAGPDGGARFEFTGVAVEE